MSTSGPKDFFISYNGADRDWAEWIAWQLEAAGYTTVLQAWDFRPGSNFVLDMQRAAVQATRTIAVLSPDYLAARFTQPEWTAAFVQDPQGETGTLLPVRVRECDLKGLWPAIVYIDLVKLNETAAKDALLAGVKRERARPTAAPPFPTSTAHPMTPSPRFPGALPPIWNVPHGRNPNFTGRESLLTDLRTALASGEPAALTQAITGLGGVGKTQIAVEYAYRHAAGYDLVWWVRAEEPATLASDYAALAEKLALPEWDHPDQGVTVEAVRRWLQGHGGWLLVFDNAREPADLHDVLPHGAAGHVCLTSRNAAWGRMAHTVGVPVLPRAESVAFLLRRTGQTDEAAAGRLAEALGDLPLALEQAGAYMEATGATLAHYLKLFGEQQRELLQKYPPSPDYPAPVATTWEMSFRAVQGASPAGADLLSLCAFLAPDDIPCDLLREGAEHLPEPLAGTVAASLALDEAVAALRRYSLVTAGDEALSVHRLVQAVARDRLSDGSRRAWAEAAARLVNGAFPGGSEDVRTWPACARLLPHAQVAAGHAEALQVAPEATGRLFNQAGLYLKGRAQFAEAKKAFERALATEETATRINNLGNVLQDLGDLAGARAAYERALAIDEAAYGPDHPNVAIRVNNLGMVLRAQGDLVGARAACERALAIEETATRINNLGLVLKDLGDLAGARATYERALAIDEAAYGPDHPNVAIRVNNLGSVLRDLGDLAGARDAFERALAIDEAAYGPDHPQVAIFVNNLGMVLKDLGDLAGARAACERARAIDEAAYGPDHPEVATDVNNLGSVLQDLGDLAGARAAYERALRIRIKFLGEDHPSTKRVRANLEGLMARMRDEHVGVEASAGEQESGGRLK